MYLPASSIQLGTGPVNKFSVKYLRGTVKNEMINNKVNIKVQKFQNK